MRSPASGSDELRLTTYVLALPFRVPIPHLSTIAVELGGDLGESWDIDARISPVAQSAALPSNMRVPRVSVRFWQRAVDIAPGSAVAPALEVIGAIRGEHHASIDVPTVPDYMTVVEAVTQLDASSDVDANLSAAFDRCLEAVDRIVRAYAYSTFDHRATRLRRESMDPLAFYILRDLRGEERGAGALALNANLPSDLRMLDDTAMKKLLEYLRQLTIRHPLLPAIEFSLERDRALARGDYSLAAVVGATALEIMLNVVLRMLLVEEGKRRAEIDQLFEDAPGLRTRLSKEYASRIGGNWDVDGTTGPVATWWRDAYGLRNRAVHGGYIARRSEAERAREASLALDRLISELLADERFKYPKTAYTRLGEPGLRRRGLLSARMSELLDKIEPEISAFWDVIR